jgi:hypothetical protein
MTRALWSEPARTTTPRLVATPYVFLITSTINTSNRPLIQSHEVRSVYGAEERLAQTLMTIKSVRDRVPEATILLLENSKLTAAQQSALESVSDRLISFAEDEDAASLRDGPYKNSAEVYVLLRTMALLDDYDYRIMFKLSGRYLLSDRFTIDRFPLDRFGFRKYGSVVSTRLYSVPPTGRSLYRRQLESSMRATQCGVSIEDVIARGLTPQQSIEVNPIGVCGAIAVQSGAFIDE